MSRQTARLILDQINGRPSFIAARYVNGAPILRGEVTSGCGLLGDVLEIARADVPTLEEMAAVRRRELAAAYGFDDSQNDKPYVFADGKAIIPIHGTLLNRFPYSWGFATGYSYIRQMVQAASADPDVDGIVYDVNSYGGLVAGCQETSDCMFDASLKGGGKPSLAVVDSNCYSAAYYLASAADQIAVTPSGGAGSIGVLTMHVDMSKMLDDIGVKVTFIHAGDHKVDGNSYEPLTEEVTSDLQREIDKMYDKFVGSVVRNRPRLSGEAVRATQARIYQADDALAVGLIDAVQTPPDALQAFFNASDDNAQPSDPFSQHEEDHTMATANAANNAGTATGPTAEEAAAAARTAERERVKAITNHPEAVGRTDLANHLAMETDLSPEAAAGILKAAPKATAPQTQEGQQQNHFRAAMDNGSNPNVGTGQQGSEGADNGGEKASRGKEILALQERVQGKAPQRGRAA